MNNLRFNGTPNQTVNHLQNTYIVMGMGTTISQLILEELWAVSSEDEPLNQICNSTCHSYSSDQPPDQAGIRIPWGRPPAKVQKFSQSPLILTPACTLLLLPACIHFPYLFTCNHSTSCALGYLGCPAPPEKSVLVGPTRSLRKRHAGGSGLGRWERSWTEQGRMHIQM